MRSERARDPETSGRHRETRPTSCWIALRHKADLTLRSASTGSMPPKRRSRDR